MTKPVTTSGRTLAFNSLYNLLGQGLPIVVALVSMPLLVKALGPERLGVLTIAWLFIGYFSIFDFGLGRALTKLVAEKIGKHEIEDIPALIWTALTLMGGLGIIGGLLLAATAQYVTYHVLKIPVPLQQETLYALYCISFAIPVITTTAGLRGVLEANQLFKGINVIRFMLGVTTYLAPVAVCLFSRDVFLIVLALVIARIFAWLMHVLLCIRIYPELRRGGNYTGGFVKPLLTFGGWMTAVNLCTPFLVYIERFFISAFLSVAFVAYYTTPYDMATKLWILPGAITGTLLPAFSIKSEQLNILFQNVLRCIFLCMFPIIIIIVSFSNEILFFWLGHEFSQNGATVLQLITIGVFINSFAQVAFVLLQSLGRPDILLKILMFEIPFYIPLTIFSIKHYGINGAASAWLIRIIIDTLLFIIISFRSSKTQTSFQLACIILAAFVSITFCAIFFAGSLQERALVCASSIACFSIISFKWLIPIKDIYRYLVAK